MPYIAPEVITQARQVDLLTYMQRCEPDELVSLGNGNYCTKTHDSLKISNGKWYWFSQGFGGHTALDYLIKVQQLSFLQAVEAIMGGVSYTPPIVPPKAKAERVLQLPVRHTNNKRVIAYLRSRGISDNVIQYCIDTGRLYESSPHHNAVFVGMDTSGTPKYAALRGTGSANFKGEAPGSDKRFSFSLPAEMGHRLHLFESAIDLLSYVTIRENNDKTWQHKHLLSLAGIYKPRVEQGEAAIPQVLQQYLSDHPEITEICLHLDNDIKGMEAAKALERLLKPKYRVINAPPPYGKDMNEYLCLQLELPLKSQGREPAR